MPRVAIRPSRDLAELLRRRRKELKITLREAEERSRAFGSVIPFSTLGKVEQGRVDPGVIRFQQLLDIYDIPKEVALDVVALETLRGEKPEATDPEALYAEAVRLWNARQIGKALGAMYALRQAVTGRPELDGLRQKAQLHLAVVVANLGRFNLSKCLIETLLRERLPDPIRLRCFVQLASAWMRLGNHELAAAMLARAEMLVSGAGPQEAGWVAQEHGLIDLAMGNHEAAARFFDRARDLFAAAGDVRGMFKVGLSRVRVHLARGEADAALALAQELLAGALPGFQAPVRILVGQAQLAAGAVQEAIATLGRAIEEADAGDAPTRYLGHHYMALAHAAAGDAAAAAAERNAARQARGALDFTPDPLVFASGAPRQDRQARA
ncbi:MAG TPA: helix-turn-helix transcriptional regulator [Candidatus Polarisedimenticolaceae bacterium]|nr:helix-turn-helix transcriptional regulator [Candidatus Polarisedimenticolaceae bacterium]